ncbi:prolipoprotein diacylglyceryl transferase [Candidatus Babeliales bacterium]|nr:prolipoprotein diacylglyceryl transferase [Candidatus Babeliales bacterium]
MYPCLAHLYGPLWIRSYGLMIAIGFLVFLFLTYRHPLRKKNIDGDTYLNTVFIGLVSGVAGGRLLFVWTAWEQFSHNWIEILYPWVGGFVVLGSILGVLLVAPLYLLAHRVRILPVLDLAGLYAALMQAIARFGCFFAGCCYGMPVKTALPWAVTFTNPEGFAPLLVPLHPTQLYMSAASFAIFIFIRFVLYNPKLKTGVLFFSYLSLDSIARFAVDFWRGDRDTLVDVIEVQGKLLQLSQVQIYVLYFFVISLVGLILVSLQRTSKE